VSTFHVNNTVLII